MEIKAKPIDFYARGLLRHRFLRAVGGALMVAAVLAMLAAAIAFAAPQAPEWLYRFTGIEVTGQQLLILVPSATVCAGLLIAAFFWGRPRIGAHWQAAQKDFVGKNWRVVAIKSGVAIAATAVLIVALAVAVWGFSLAAVLILMTAVIAALFVVGIAIGTLLFGGLVALVQGLYFRAWGVVGFVGFVVAAIGGGAMLYEAYNQAGFNFRSSSVVAFAAMGMGELVLGIEFAWQAWWQLRSSKQGFFAARGWRPPVHRLITTTRRHMGLPGFLANVKRERWRLSFLYFGVAACNAAILAGLIWPICSFGLGHDWWLVALNWVLGWGTAFGAFKLGAILSGRAERRVTAVYQKVREWDQRAPVVFLRSFNQDEAKLKVPSLDPTPKWMAGVARPQTLDELLLEHASPYGPVIAIGDPRTDTPPLGAARIYVREEGNEWQNVVTGLVDASRAVVMCPTSTEGVRWELQLLEHHNFYARAIYLANPEITPEENLKVFEAMNPVGFTLIVPKNKTPIAAYYDPKESWKVLCARRRSLQAYTVALNYALQAVLGVKGMPAPKRPKKEKVKKEKRAKAKKGVRAAPQGEKQPAAA